MAATVEEVCNKALGLLGTKNKVASISEQSVEAEVCNLWFTTVRDIVLRAAHWTSASAAAKLVVAVERNPEADWVATDPPPGYLFAYTLPADILIPRYLSGYGRFELSMSSGNVKRLNSNTEDAILIYTKQQTDVTKWDSDLETTIEFALASYICLKLTGKQDRLEAMVNMANQRIMTARLNDANSQEMIQDTVAPWHAARGIAIASDPRYIFPYGPLVNVGDF